MARAVEDLSAGESARAAPVILVTLGTHPQPMDRVVSAIDDLLERGVISDHVIIQSAAFGRIPRLAQAVGIADYETLAAWAQGADVIVTHGGPGSIMLALAAGRQPVVIPRRADQGEHVDDHQLRFARWLTKRRGLTLVEDMTTLGEAIEQARIQPTIARPTGPAPEVIARLRLAIERR